MNNFLICEEVRIALNANDGNLTKTCIILNTKYSTLYNFVRKYNIDYNSKKPPLPSKEIIEEAYKRLGSLSLVAKELGGTKEGIRCAMQRYELKINAQVLHTVDDHFFSRDNEQSFYWAGFLAADGCVQPHSGKNKTINYLSLALSSIDKIHVELLRTHINATTPIGEVLVKNSKRNPEHNDTWKSEIKITSEQICKDLQRFNIVPRKSLIYTFPEWLITHPLLNHFMRGYNDGDGSFYIPKLAENRSIKQIYFSLRGTEKFLTSYRSIIESQCQLEERNTPIRVNYGTGSLEYGGNGVLKKIAQFLYKDATIYLPRKYEKVKELL